MPLITLVIPAWNAAATISRTLASALLQTFADWEAIVVDDGSTDATPAILQTWAALDARIRPVRVAQGGVSHARNHGMSLARGDWVLFLDADDELRPDHLEALWQATLPVPVPDVVHGNWLFRTQDGAFGPLMTTNLWTAPLAEFVNGCKFVIHSAMVRRSVLDRVGGFDPGLKVCEDWDMWQRIARLGARYRHTDRAVAQYTITPGSLSFHLDAHLACGIEVIRRAYRGWPDGQVDPDIAQSTLAQRETAYALWIAGVAIGAGKPVGETLAACPIALDPDVDAETAAMTLLAGIEWGMRVLSPDWLDRWTGFLPQARAVLEQMQPGVALHGFAEATLIKCQRIMAARVQPGRVKVGASGQLGTLAVQPFEIGAWPEVAAPADLPHRTERVHGIVLLAGKEVGRFEAYAAEVRDPARLAAILVDFVGAPAFDKASATGNDGLTGEDGRALRLSIRDPGFWQGVHDRELLDRAGQDRAGHDRAHPAQAAAPDALLAAITGRPNRALHLGCGAGSITRALAGRVGHLLAADFAPAALARAQAHCAGLPNVDFAEIDLQVSALPGGFDLILCEDIQSYLVSAADLERAARRLSAALVPGGQLVLTHATQIADVPFGAQDPWRVTDGATIARIFRGHPALELVQQGADGPRDVVVLRRIAQPAATLGAAPAVMAAKPTGVPILAYHRVAADPVPALARYAVSPDEFHQQMAWLRAEGFHAVGVSAFEALVWDGVALPENPVLVTFDDGYQDTHDAAWPILKDCGMMGTVFLPTEKIGHTADWDSHFGPPAPLMNWDSVRRMQAGGIEFAAHGARHLPMFGLTDADMRIEGDGPLARIKAELGVAVRSVAYPYGANDEAVQRALLAMGYRLAFTTDSRRWQPKDRVMSIPRLDVARGLGADGFARLILS